MDLKHVIIKTIYSWEKQEIKGKTLFQKLVYFIQNLVEKELGSKPFDFKYFAYYYGPYSEILTKELNSLVYYQIIKENAHDVPFDSPFENVKYFYKINEESAKKILKNIKDRQEYSILDRVEEKSKLLSRHEIAHDINQISIAAKIHFLIKNHSEKIKNIDDLIELAQSKNWKIEKKDVSRSGKFLIDLNLI